MNTALRLIAVATLGIAQGHNLTREQALTRSYAADIRRQSTPLSTPAVQSWIDRMGNQLAAGFRSGIDWSFEVTADASATEPVAVPGGTVFVPAGAILAAADEQAFMRLLAHHMAHAANPNSLVPVRANGVGIPMIFMGGSHGNQLVPRAFNAHVEQLEREADAIAGEALATVENISSGQFDEIQELVRGTPKPSRRPPTLHRK